MYLIDLFSFFFLYHFRSYGAGYDLAARRKNATRESTATLKAWLNEHKKNPYPTKGEKIMLAIITKMTLTQVSTWFANARRRLKKENKMTWEPKNKTDDDDDAMVSDDEKDKDDLDLEKSRDHKGRIFHWLFLGNRYSPFFFFKNLRTESNPMPLLPQSIAMINCEFRFWCLWRLIIVRHR